MRGKRLVGWLRNVVVGAVCVVVAGVIYQSVATVIDRRRYPPPGRLVDIGGYRLHLNCMGNDSGAGPTVVAEAGSYGNSLTWARILPELSQSVRVCAYDRAGLGWSDPGPTPRTGRQIASELHTLLQTAEVHGPFILVGHSLGGLYVRLYASQYPEEVAGIVLVDSVHEDQYADAQQNKSRIRGLEVFRIGTAIGFIRLLGTLRLSSRFEKVLHSAPDEVAAANRSFYYRNQTWITAIAEAEAAQENSRQAKDAGTLGDIPLTVITAPDDSDDKETRQRWNDYQLKLVGLSRRHTHLIAKDSSHFIQLDDPQLVIRAIRDLVEAATPRVRS